jgi:NTE family protein
VVAEKPRPRKTLRFPAVVAGIERAASLADRPGSAKNDDVEGKSGRTAIVFSGGGSRGAYEAGVILYLRKRLAQVLGHPVRFDIITGTSVGAINAAFLAATIDRPDMQAQRICDAWRALQIERMISLRPTDLLRAARLLVGGKPPAPTPGSYRYGGIVQTTGLERFVLRSIPWRAIRHNMKRGHLAALAISATHIATGYSVVFIDSLERAPEALSGDAFVRCVASRIGPRHVLASAAIPVLFPAVKVGDRFYTDGGLRQRTPMTPAIRLGADRILAISLRHVATEAEEGVKLAREREEAYPRPLFVFGKLFNALLLDHTGYDLDRMTRLNAMIDEGTRVYGDDFTDVMNRKLAELRGSPLRRLEAVHLRPSRDIGGMASDFVKRGSARIEGRIFRRMLQRLAQGESRHESDLLSYLLFDGRFAAALIDLGYRDAAKHEDELAKLFAERA